MGRWPGGSPWSRRSAPRVLSCSTWWRASTGARRSFLETGKLFAETLAFKDELVAWLRLEDALDPPRAGRPRALDPDGTLWRSEPDLCCHIRKTEPLDEAPQASPAGSRAASASRGMRTALPAVETDPVTGQIKLNPLAGWSPDDIRHYRRLRHCRCIRWWRGAIPRSAASLHARRQERRGFTRRALVAARQDRVRHPPRREFSRRKLKPHRAARDAAPCRHADGQAPSVSPNQALTASRMPLPGLNFTFLLAAILMALPVCGLRPHARAAPRPRTRRSLRSKPCRPCSALPGCRAHGGHCLALASLLGLPVAVATAELSSSRVINAPSDMAYAVEGLIMARSACKRILAEYSPNQRQRFCLPARIA